MDYPILSKILLGGTATVACVLAPNDASADDGLAAAVEVGANVVTSDLSDDDTLRAVGPAVALRLGYAVYGSTVRLTPEAKFSFEAPGTPRAGALMGGARLNFAGSVSPAVFAHAGGLVGDLRGFVWDAGGGLDFILNDTLDLGLPRS